MHQRIKRVWDFVSFGYCMQFSHFNWFKIFSRLEWVEEIEQGKCELLECFGYQKFTTPNKYARAKAWTNEWTNDVRTYVLVRYVWQKVNLQYACVYRIHCIQRKKWKVVLICMALNQLPRIQFYRTHIYFILFFLFLFAFYCLRESSFNINDEYVFASYR